MPFDYNKRKQQEEHGSFWTSYSDLFLGMSVVFLLLYVTASLRVGATGIQSQMENQKLSMKVKDLEKQLAMYDSIKKEYMDQKATPDESKQYNELMDKLSLLKEEAKTEKEKLLQASNENSKKEQALNQYQQLVRNMINANLMAKNKVKTRDNVINDQDVKIDEQAIDIDSLKKDVTTKENLIADSEKKIDGLKSNLKIQLNEVRRAYNAKKMTEKAYEAKVAAIQAEGSNKIASLVGETEKTKQELAATQGKLGQLSGELTKTKGALAETAGALGQAKENLGKTQGALAATKGELAGTKGLLDKARAEADARKQIAKDIKAGFKSVGVQADVDDQTGEVQINFGDVYFDNDSAKLKEKMKSVLQKAMPVYSKSLMSNQKTASKISAIEIIGFASPTYKGKLVDPKSLGEENRNAINYNLDLSFQRAKSIFQYVFDDGVMKFDHQKDLLPLIKVTGRSFLAEKDSGKKAGTGSDFCGSHDCKKAQRVIIKFNFEDKK